MSKTLKAFGDTLLKESRYEKLFQKQTPGKRIFPPQAKESDKKLQLRLDAGEIHSGQKKVYLQVNSQADNEALKKFRKKHGTDANLATGTINENEPKENQKQAAEALWEDLMNQAKENLG
ncbi:hypothetical protein LTR66_012159 [Elasticomyces elasticus]|nr:hypothetical protein LTR66_012159 [Elasticomyces elasticus]KAK5009563.1 hypothetical protein LTR28_000430 [Elasticomyces elasticus]